MTKPREFWLFGTGEYWDPGTWSDGYPGKNDDGTERYDHHVIEFEAYQKLLKANEIMREALEFYAEGDYSTNESMGQYHSKIDEDEGHYAMYALKQVDEIIGKK